MTPLIQPKNASPLIFIALLLACFAFLPRTQAVVPPPPGGYPNFTTAAGDHALQALTLGVGNTGIGTFSLFSVTTGNFNTAVGAGSLDLNLGDSNTATGAAALLFNTTGTENTANGTAALEFNDTGNFNTASGAFALFSNTTGEVNTATGVEALLNNTEGSNNTANGWEALRGNIDGSLNTATGAQALRNSIGGMNNTATGIRTLFFNDFGSSNTATGADALHNNTTGNFNTAYGDQALLNNATGSGNLALGVLAGAAVTTANNVIAIGAGGVNVSDTCFIGNIFGVTSSGGAAVFVNSAGQLGTNTSSRRFKDEIKPMDSASEVLFALKPVIFRYKKEIDPAGTGQFGLVAEDVEALNPDLVVRDKEGKVITVRYDAVNAMLLNEFLKEHRKVEQLTKDFESKFADQQKQIKALTAGLQKVSAQLELSKAASQTVLNDQ